jgi:hypothetical protein
MNATGVRELTALRRALKSFAFRELQGLALR